MARRKKKENHIIWFWLGVAGMLLTLVPYVILGEDAIFTYHDQLDGEMIAYLLQAKNLFSGNMLPEFMGGMPKTALTMPAPICVLLFLGGNGFAALTFMQLMGRLVGFTGMYLLSEEITQSDWIGAAVGILYGLLPFLPVYGLSQYGIPLLFWCGLQLRKQKHLALAFGYVILFGLSSSLVLVGFGLLGMGALVLLWDLRGKERKPHFLIGWLVLAGIYVAENSELLFQVFGMGEAVISHKAEYKLQPQPFWGTFGQALLQGGQHSEGYHKYLILVVMAAVIAAMVIGKFGRTKDKREVTDNTVRKLWRCLGISLGWNVFFAFAAAVWGSEICIGLRERTGALGAFQLDRLLWIAPCLWYLAAACGAALIWDRRKRLRGGAGILTGACMAAVIAAGAFTAFLILYVGDIKSNIQKLRNPEYGLMSFRDYYAIGVMEQVREFLAETSGKGQEEYRVVSLGIDPAAALYHGFYSLDGYSNNYPLSYKHRFREVIAPELAKSEYLTDYFDDWGNRCYMFSAECPGYYTIEKKGFRFMDYSIDAGALRDMGCRYIFSAACIQDADLQGLMLTREEPFETEDSYYQIFVYEILK